MADDDDLGPEDPSGFGPDDPGSDGESGPDDLGEPIDELRGFQEAASIGFVGRVVRSLHRRSLGSQLATLGWTGFWQVIVEFLTMIFSLFEPPDRDQGETD